jgi:hypothetical protein
MGDGPLYLGFDLSTQQLKGAQTRRFQTNKAPN